VEWAGPTDREAFSRGIRRQPIWWATMTSLTAARFCVDFGRWGIRDRPISPRSPWKNPCAERLLGTLRRDCLDHLLIFGARHLRHILTSYSSYYDQSRRIYCWTRMRRCDERSRYLRAKRSTIALAASQSAQSCCIRMIMLIALLG
jgi:hypothetical protein